MSRTPTPQIDRVFGREQTLIRWHRLWLWHLQAQKGLNPAHPATPSDIDSYRKAVEMFEQAPDSRGYWLAEIDEEETKTRHELVAALNVLNRVAAPKSHIVHMGLTSCDITDTGNQWAIREAAQVIEQHAAVVIRLIVDRIAQYAELKILARTHGQPAQLTTYGHRMATLLGPLLDWLWAWRTLDYPLRPPHGAVGTAADLMRVLQPDEKASSTGTEAQPGASEGPVATEIGPAASELTERLIAEYVDNIRYAVGFSRSMLVSRQTYHRSYDLHWMSLVARLASIAETWATDRRLEAMLGWGCETQGWQQVGSSAMPHKNNPRVCERIVALTTTAYAQLMMGVQNSGREWLEGDVSTSAVRRDLVPNLLRTADQILSNWHWLLRHWEIDVERIRNEIVGHAGEWASSAMLHQLISQGEDRTVAHATLRAMHRSLGDGPLDQYQALIQRLDVDTIGTIQQQIDAVCSAAVVSVAQIPYLPFEGEPI